MMLEKTKKMLYEHCFTGRPKLVDDCQVIGCAFCGATGLCLPDGITHKEGCELGAVLDELENADKLIRERDAYEAASVVKKKKVGG
ncbi:MAG TPA: hypothetical protein ENH11_00495 [Candidatus Acetothermia bacterium]|nr:hypothetical protein [Candidatus Acetothermia bacterium]